MQTNKQTKNKKLTRSFYIQPCIVLQFIKSDHLATSTKGNFLSWMHEIVRGLIDENWVLDRTV